MNTQIDNVCQNLSDFALSLKQDAADKIRGIHPNTDIATTPAPQIRQGARVSNPERPWIIGGLTALAVGTMGVITSGSSWSYLASGAGATSIIYGLAKKKKQSGHSELLVPPPVSMPKGYEVADKVIELSKMVESKWRTKVEECKGVVQQTIESSATSAELKDSLMGRTYITERVSIDFNEVVTRLNSQPQSSFASILSEYESIVCRCIDNAATEQITVYRNISHSL